MDPDDLRDLLGRGDLVWGGTRIVACPDIGMAIREMLMPLDAAFLSNIHCAVMFLEGHEDMKVRDMVLTIHSLRALVPENCETSFGCSRDDTLEKTMRIKLLLIGSENNH